MDHKIKVVTQPANRITINTQQQDQVKEVKVVGATQVGTAGVQTLSQLRDVDARNIVNGATLVYDETANKFVVKVLPVVDGGTF
jgi:hypothetical protein